MTSGCFSTATPPSSSAKRSSAAAPSSPATCLCARTAFGASAITRPVNWSPAGRRAAGRADRRGRGSIEPASATLRPQPTRLLDRDAHLTQPGGCFGIDQPVPALGTKAPLERGNGDLFGGGADAIADPREIGEGAGALHHPDPASASAGQIGARLRPQPD